MRLKVFLSVWYDMWNFLERDSAMIFSIPLMCYEYRDVSLLKRVQTTHQATALCDFTFTGSKDALCIHPSALELSVNTNMCEPCPRCRIVMYIDISDARNSNRSSASFMFRYDVILHLRAKPLLL